nr:probable tRNA (uracil-O(2)-)-methyltransferase [Nomia melanderi]XP_031835710.1 probable tRNA (uracil-O(2)-)-methyltransferase [Nomia melanderi]XP_031835711.1 probable tRNA (uracil-O(2)-)-methyltransferase [Nomia melanderi]XP_031835712.1 probable tRNA (uracil-O(2)-)-methyltransferase [Nomia melanderi]XP_031835714.1 probable tRNA (uracil-O(2)-)-methyltransferase [Nomia melanderi]XP_031835715.1 probable tRNA (uracil-O(2)-)-methyltransferase [Nomia melanderi]XP_031835716.1 probable tRNA (uraci
MEFTTLTSVETNFNESQFWQAIDIWYHNPQVANRRLLTCVELLNVEVDCNITEIFLNICALDLSSVTAAPNENNVDIKKLLDTLCIADNVSAPTSKPNILLHVRKQLPRVPNLFSCCIEFSLLEKEENRVINIHKSFCTEKKSLGPQRPYAIQQGKDGYTSISVYQLENSLEDCSLDWLKTKFFPCMLKWMRAIPKAAASHLPSLSLISAERYATLYWELKEKYSTELIKNWPENTDPLKFVYEDIAIATYLLLLWEKERLERGTQNLQSFVDLGCGNGLLVHILFSEGHRGLGIDLRRRKIWDLYPPETPLQVCTIIPSSATVYPGFDWIIGNHSDELSPWIPVIAARSSTDCRLFLLPCCPYELDGTKYQRYSAAKSQYSEYIDYLKHVCNVCGFRTYVDKLRIPSTKRICLVGWERTGDDDVEAKENRIREMISAKATLIQQENKTDVHLNEGSHVNGWTCDFKPRDTVEKVRNCTQLEKTLIANIVNIVANQLLENGRLISLDESTKKNWNAGRRLDLRQLAESIPRESLIRLRKECGGLQTLLKNHSHVFRVMQGKVEFRVPGTEVHEKSKRKKSSVRRKVKPCWFHERHPNGCPVTEANCAYKH